MFEWTESVVFALYDVWWILGTPWREQMGTFERFLKIDMGGLCNMSGTGTGTGTGTDMTSLQ